MNFCRDHRANILIYTTSVTIQQTPNEKGICSHLYIFDSKDNLCELKMSNEKRSRSLALWVKAIAVLFSRGHVERFLYGSFRNASGVRRITSSVRSSDCFSPSVKL